ncbi:hypothetical protein GCM10027262_63940 [Nocardia tengchongensis]
MGDPIGRMGRIDRQEGGPRLGHRPHRKHRVRGTRHRDRDDILGTDAPLDQLPSPSIRTLVHLAVARLPPSGDDRHRLGIHRDRVGQQLGQGDRGHRGCTVTGQQIGSLGGVEHVDRPDRDRRIGDHRLQDPDPPTDKGIDRRGIEHIRGEGDRAGQLILTVGYRQGELQVGARYFTDLADRQHHLAPGLSR